MLDASFGTVRFNSGDEEVTTLTKHPDGSVSSSTDFGKIGRTLAPEEQAAVLAALVAHDPAPILFQGEEVVSAADVDRITARRIRRVLAGPWEDEPVMAAQAMLRKVEGLLAAVYVIEYQAGATQQEKDSPSPPLRCLEVRPQLADAREPAPYAAPGGGGLQGSEGVVTVNVRREYFLSPRGFSRYFPRIRLFFGSAGLYFIPS